MSKKFGDLAVEMALVSAVISVGWKRRGDAVLISISR
jgi:hypothetical protein